MKSVELIESVLSDIGEYELTNLIEEKQNVEYEGVRFKLENQYFRSRLAKLTAKKKGYFVVFWEKDSFYKNQPYKFQESPDKVIVSVLDEEKIGQFIFPKAVLHKYGILKSENFKGKMAIRVYPAWEQYLNSSATKTQKWQKDYFIDLSRERNAEVLRALYFGG